MAVHARMAAFAEAAESTAKAEREIQQAIDRKEKSRSTAAKEHGAMQAGARRYPEPPLPRQHQKKPGSESDLNLAPMYDAPHYLGSEKLKDRVALITGGDSGIGRSVAVLYAREGADIAVAYLNEHKDAEETKRAVEKEGRRCILLSGDVADPQFCKAAVTATIEEFGRLDMLVNNAAFQEHVLDFDDLTETHFDRTLKTNLYGYFHMAKAAVPHMKPGSAIVMTGSVTGIMGNRNLLDYSMTKGGIHAFVRSLASHLIGKGIRVNAVAPGPVWTPLNPADRNAEGVSKFGSQTPMKRPAQPKEIAPAFVFLAAPVVQAISPAKYCRSSEAIRAADGQNGDAYLALMTESLPFRSNRASATSVRSATPCWRKSLSKSSSDICASRSAL